MISTEPLKTSTTPLVPPWPTSKGPARLILAPMEGVADAPMRAMMAEFGGYDFGVTEFFRIQGSVPGRRAYREHAPELEGLPEAPWGGFVPFQILGGKPEFVALAALRAAELGARAIDLNFGCPAPVVNRHDGGASLLRDPCRLEQIVRSVRLRVPKSLPVSVKIRLGWEDPSGSLEIAERVEAAGASWLTVHARTKLQGYTPPAYWSWIGKISSAVSIPVIANGEIWTVQDARNCREESGTSHLMLGRGGLRDPWLARRIRGESEIPRVEDLWDPNLWVPLFRRFTKLSLAIGESRVPRQKLEDYVLARLKQWARYAAHGLDSESRERHFFSRVKFAKNLPEFWSLVADRGDKSNQIVDGIHSGTCGGSGASAGLGWSART